MCLGGDARLIGYPLLKAGKKTGSCTTKEKCVHLGQSDL